jgi:hypothetical protein
VAGIPGNPVGKTHHRYTKGVPRRRRAFLPPIGQAAAAVLRRAGHPIWCSATSTRRVDKDVTYKLPK